MKILNDRVGQILLLLGFCISAQNAFGTQIESGSIYICCMSQSSGTFSLAGDGFAVTGFTYATGVWGPGGGCSDNCINVFGGVFGTDIGSGSATIGATTILVNWGYGSQIIVTGPQIPLDHGPGTYVGSFSFTGTLCGSTANPYSAPPPCIVSLPNLTGSGLVSVNVEVSPYNGALQEVDATYTFFAPEPSSIVLVGTAGLLFFLRRRTLKTRQG